MRDYWRRDSSIIIYSSKLDKNMEYIVLLLAIFILGLVTVYSYFVIKKEFGLSQYEKRSKKKIDAHLEHVINSSEQVLLDIQKRMKQLLSQTHHFKSEIDSQAKTAFVEFKDRYETSLRSELSEVEKQYEEEFYRSAKDLKAALDIKLKEQLDRSEKLVEAFTESELKRVKNEVEEYEKQQEEKTAQKLQVIFTKVLEDVLKKSLSAEDQKKLIWSSLESIKKESFGSK